MTSLFEDLYQVLEVDKDGKVFDRVSRLECRGEDHEDVHLSLDYNCDIYSLKIGEKFDFVLRSSLASDSNSNNNNVNDMEEDCNAESNSIIDAYEYVMYGKIFRIQRSKANKKCMEVYASFGGLLMCLTGEKSNFSRITDDQKIYLLIRKIRMNIQ